MFCSLQMFCAGHRPHHRRHRHLRPRDASASRTAPDAHGRASRPRPFPSAPSKCTLKRCFVGLFLLVFVMIVNPLVLLTEQHHIPPHGSRASRGVGIGRAAFNPLSPRPTPRDWLSNQPGVFCPRRRRRQHQPDDVDVRVDVDTGARRSPPSTPSST